MAETVDPITLIDVDSAGDGRYRLTWDARVFAGPITIRAATASAALATAPILVAAASSPAVLPALAPRTRHYFRLEPAQGAALVVAQRNVPLTGCVNFRDLGGYATADGRRVRWGRLFRSGHLARLDAADKAWFGALEVATVCDFRLPEEAAGEATELPGAPRVDVLGIPPGVGDRHYLDRLFARDPAPAEVLEGVHAIMRSYARDVRAQYRRLFERVLAAERGAVLINCSAGKERTGLGAALILSALGVPRATVLYDFMLSRRYFPAAAEVPRVLEKYGVRDRGAAGRALIAPLLETHESYLQSALAVLDEEFGSIAAFLQRGLGLGDAELAGLRTRYTEHVA